MTKIGAAPSTAGSTSATAPPNPDNGHPNPIKREHYDEIKRDNAMFTDYYQRQGIVPPEEWSSLVASLATSLPTTFRLTGHRPEEALATRRHLQGLLSSLESPQAAYPLPWYEPAGMAWHLDGDRKGVRTDERWRAVHRWLVAATENGDVSRQEAVSMVPPLLLDVRGHHLVLDMCAAPGSKTAQLVERLHADASESVHTEISTDKKEEEGHTRPADGRSLPTGLVIANDADQQRAYMLYHQVKRILSPSLLVTNNDGTTFPALSFKQLDDTSAVECTLFDRILADVPCSGDGTLRKNALLWRQWTPNLGLGLHPLQVRLLEKAVRLLRPGGRLVYSTCSMNPVENEAVVAHALSRNPSLRLLDVSDELPALKRRPGLSHWRVLSKDGKEVEQAEAVPGDQRKRFPPSLFPRPEYARMGLERCLRIYPHLQNTGGFFVAVLEKTLGQDEQTGEERAGEERAGEGQATSRETMPNSAVESASASAQAIVRPAHKKGKLMRVPMEGEFRRLCVSSDPVLGSIFSFYGIDKVAMAQAGFGFFVRSERDSIKCIVMVSPQAHRLLAATVAEHCSKDGQDTYRYNGSLKIVNAGVRAWEVYESKGRPVPVPCPYRPLYESAALLRPWMTRRVMSVSGEVMRQLLSTGDSVRVAEIEECLGQGGAVLETEAGRERLRLIIPVWISERGVKAFVAMANKPALLLQLQGE